MIPRAPDVEVLAFHVLGVRVSVGAGILDALGLPGRLCLLGGLRLLLLGNGPRLRLGCRLRLRRRALLLQLVDFIGRACRLRSHMVLALVVGLGWHLFCRSLMLAALFSKLFARVGALSPPHLFPGHAQVIEGGPGNRCRVDRPGGVELFCLPAGHRCAGVLGGALRGLRGQAPARLGAGGVGRLVGHEGRIFVRGCGCCFRRPRLPRGQGALHLLPGCEALRNLGGRQLLLSRLCVLDQMTSRLRELLVKVLAFPLQKHRGV
mmetsp:Transcript_73666/g.208632  ORF Transcript_73666/g.208632 Transcript_73666/m.208632 type:complete len:263 (-) Transcript_73666:115-903(-)